MENPRPVSEFHERDRDLARRIDEVLSGYTPIAPEDYYEQLSFEKVDTFWVGYPESIPNSSVLKIGSTAVELKSNLLN